MTALLTGPGDKPPYPFETLRDWYVSPFGGRTAELEDGQLGLREEALAENTAIDASRDRVVLAVLGEPRKPRPLVLRRQFEVVPLDALRPDALRLSPNGEVVLSERETGFLRRPHLQPRVGQALVLNRARGKIATSPEKLAEVIAEELRRRQGS